METRRSFLRKTGKGALFSTLSLTSASAYSLGILSPDLAPAWRIGIIGAENSHTRSILAGMAVLEALERSVITGDWVGVPGID